MLPWLLGFLLGSLFRSGGRVVGVLTRVARDEGHFPYIFTPLKSERPQSCC
jgi:hypothetical protein